MRANTLLLLLYPALLCAQGNIEKGIECLENLDYSCAKSEFKLAQENGNDTAGIWLALTHLEIEDYKSAENTINKVLEKLPDWEDAALLKGDILYAQHGVNEAIKFLGSWVKSHPENCLVYQERARIYLEELAPEEQLIPELEHSLYSCSDSDAVQSLLYLAALFDYYERYTEAYNAYNELLELAPNKSDVLENASAFYMEIGEYDRALKLVMKYIEQVPQDSATYFQLGYGNMAVEDYASAAQHFTTYIKYDSTDAEGWYNRGLCYAAIKEYPFAYRDFNKALELAPEMDDAFFNIALLHQNKGEYSKAIEIYTTYISRNESDPEALMNRGWCKYYNNDENGACADWNRVKDQGYKDFYKSVRSLCK